MPKLSDKHKQFLANATTRYKNSLPRSTADEFLAARGLNHADPRVSRFRLGYVGDPLPGHDMYQGMLAIPYMRWSPGTGWSVVSMRFRCIRDGCQHPNHGKYMSNPGDSPRLFNAMALLDDTESIAITEGEIDAITATVCGIPAVGIAGVETWKPHFREPFLGYETVYVLADGDDPGMKFAHNLAKELPNAKILPSTHGEDVSSMFVKHGEDAIIGRMRQ